MSEVYEHAELPVASSHDLGAGALSCDLIEQVDHFRNAGKIGSARKEVGREQSSIVNSLGGNSAVAKRAFEPI